MNIQSIYCEKDKDGRVKVSILVNEIWYVAIDDSNTFISHYCEVDNCTLGENLPRNRELNAWHN